MYIFAHISLLILRTIRNTSEKVVEKIKAHLMFNNFPPENHAACELMWKNIVEQDRTQMTNWRMRFACWITKATNTHLAYVILTAFALHQWLYVRTYLIVTSYIQCLSFLLFVLQSQNRLV